MEHSVPCQEPDPGTQDGEVFREVKWRWAAVTGNAAVAIQGAAFFPHKQLEANELFVHTLPEITSM